MCFYPEVCPRNQATEPSETVSQSRLLFLYIVDISYFWPSTGKVINVKSEVDLGEKEEIEHEKLRPMHVKT